VFRAGHGLLDVDIPASRNHSTLTYIEKREVLQQRENLKTMGCLFLISSDFSKLFLPSSYLF
jgi:hypothetical protein